MHSVSEFLHGVAAMAPAHYQGLLSGIAGHYEKKGRLSEAQERAVLVAAGRQGKDLPAEWGHWSEPVHEPLIQAPAAEESEWAALAPRNSEVPFPESDLVLTRQALVDWFEQVAILSMQAADRLR